jgi:hypothetical protein
MHGLAVPSADCTRPSAYVESLLRPLIQIARILFAYGADPKSATKSGKTAADVSVAVL